MDLVELRMIPPVCTSIQTGCIRRVYDGIDHFHSTPARAVRANPLPGLDWVYTKEPIGCAVCLNTQRDSTPFETP